MKTISCCIIDDELAAHRVLSSYINQIPYLRLVATCTSAVDALPILLKERPDLLFLDIRMPGLNGLDLLKAFTFTYHPHVILTTAHTEYAVDSYEYDVSDYLLKPIALERFMRALGKVYLGETPGNHSFSHRIWIKKGYEQIQVMADEILYIEGMDDHVNVFLQDKSSRSNVDMPIKFITSYVSMQFMEDSLPQSLFIRISRSYIVHKTAIYSIDKKQIKLINGLEISIGPTYRDSLNVLFSNKPMGY
ncbi:LytR/AlgR family response regulator transcription factor [Siphonobacter curvatus]|uniref:DNA-binding response regulator n=1 Tax=Siphonobacter curvatus TaxID=2094562 RepID=A0A2S7IEX8_9BACT|nr:response regulator transcription factor [Siphonobacter curvatus]PQA53219.1 hypothetical protein C5O19_25150 [Siphonobacter curvatus]